MLLRHRTVERMLFSHRFPNKSSFARPVVASGFRIRCDSFLFHVFSNIFFFFRSSGEEFKAVVRPKRFIRFVLIYIITNSLILSVPLFSHVPQVVGTFNDRTAKPEGFVWQIGTQKIDTCFRQSKGF